ncbi:MAG: outer membrane protein transport protein [Deltaproteobacteria bacterium]|nr:outer membrane protein transport protein [Deltaproteobacteria bacterium]
MRTIAFLSLITVTPCLARADDTHYQNLLVGEHALGLGGAFTALADDAAAAFYNPAGLALIARSSMSGSLSVYGFESRRIDDAFQTALGEDDFEDASSPTFPISVGLVRKFGPKRDDGVRDHAVAFSTVIPFQSDVTFRGDLFDALGFQHVRVAEEDRWLWVGPSYAYRLSPRLALGITGYLASRELEHTFDRSYADAGELQAGVRTLEYGLVEASEVELDDVSLMFRIGVLWQPSDSMRLGLMVAAPSIRLDSSATVTHRSLLADFVVPGAESGTYSEARDVREGSSPFPFNVRLGAAALFGASTVVSADLSLYAPISYDRLGEAGADVAVDDYFVQRIERRLTVNGNLGLETLLGGHFPVRAGLFTNFSSAPAPQAGDVAMPAQVHRFGAALSAGYRDEGYDIQVGVAGLYGVGNALVPTASGDPFYEVTRVEDSSLYVFLSGAKEAAGRVVDRWTH